MVSTTANISASLTVRQNDTSENYYKSETIKLTWNFSQTYTEEY